MGDLTFSCQALDNHEPGGTLSAVQVCVQGTAGTVASEVLTLLTIMKLVDS